jgi:hypothetical protein
MSAQTLEQRLAALEAEVAELKKQIRPPEPAKHWVDKIYGTFANDPLYEEAMRLGRKYRESLRPKSKSKKKRKKKNGDS